MASTIQATGEADASGIHADPAPPGSIAYRVMFAIAGSAFGVALFFFLSGAADGTVSASNIGLWLALLAVPGGVLAGAAALRRHGWTGLATLLLSLLAVPTVLAVALIVFLSLTVTNWH